MLRAEIELVEAFAGLHKCEMKSYIGFNCFFFVAFSVLCRFISVAVSTVINLIKSSNVKVQKGRNEVKKKNIPVMS